MLIFSALIAAAQAPGTPDTTFGQNGQTLFQPAITGTIAHRNSVLQADNKIVTLLQTSVSVRSLLARLNPDGSLDTTFGSGGYVYMTWGGTGSGVAFALAKQIVAGEERFVAAGWAPCGRKSCLRVERYTSSGSLDTTFGSAGVMTMSSVTQATSMVTQPADQKILMANTAGQMVRLTANGLPDPSFGTQGVSTATGMGIRGLAVTSTGRILACGNYSAGKSSYFAVAQLNSNGTLDDGGRNDSTPGDSFGSGGRATIDFWGYGGLPYAVAVDAAGRIIAGGQANNNGALARWSANGQIDTSFGTGGKAWLDIGGRQDIFTSLAVQGDGKIVLTGEGRFAGTVPADMLTARYNDNGTIDTSFGAGGWIMQDAFGNYDQAQSVLVQSDPACGCEKIVIVGAGGTGTITYQAVALRYYP